MDDTNTQCEWCCELSSHTLDAGNYSIRIFSVALSGLLFIMLGFLLVKISVHYFRLFRKGKQYEDASSLPLTSLQNYRNFRSINSAPDFGAQQFNQNHSISQDVIQGHEIKFDKTNSTIQSVPGMSQKPVKEKTNMRGFHFLYLMMAAGWFLLQSVILLSSASSSTKIIRIIDTFLYEGHALIDNCIIILAFFPNDKKLSVISTMVISLIIIGLGSVTVAGYSLGNYCGTCSFFFPAPEAFYTYGYFLIFYTICLALRYLNWRRLRPRKSVTIWLWYMFSVYAASVIGSGVVLFLGVDVGFCLMDLVIIWYATLYAPALYYTLVRDSAALSTTQPIQPVVNDNPISMLLARAKDLVQNHSVGWIPYDELILGERLGIGAAGEVHKGFFLQTPVAIKRLFDNGKVKALEDFFREVTVMSKLSHPNVLLFMGVCVRDNGDRYIITEMMSKGSVFDLIHPNLSFSAIRDPEADNELTPERTKGILVQCARGMSYLHSFQPAMLHRDLKSHNLLVDDHWNVKVADFGLSRPLSMETMTAAGTPQWSAPEVIRQDRYTTKADVYSFGVIIYELLSRNIPYANLGPLAAAHQVGYDGLRPIFPSNCDPAYIALAELCWSENPESRPSFPEIVKKLEEMQPPRI